MLNRAVDGRAGHQMPSPFSSSVLASKSLGTLIPPLTTKTCIKPEGCAPPWLVWLGVSAESVATNSRPVCALAERPSALLMARLPLLGELGRVTESWAVLTAANKGGCTTGCSLVGTVLPMIEYSPVEALLSEMA